MRAETREWVASAEGTRTLIQQLFSLSSAASAALESDDIAELSSLLGERGACMASADDGLRRLAGALQDPRFAADPDLANACGEIAGRLRELHDDHCALRARLQERQQELSREMKRLDEGVSATSAYLYPDRATRGRMDYTR